LRDAVSKVQGKFTAIEMIRLGHPHLIRAGDRYHDPARHRHVAGLYARLVAGVGTDRLLIWEDDVHAPAHGLRQLSDQMYIGEKVAAVGGVYQSGHRPDLACAALGQHEAAQGLPRMEDVPNEPTEALCLGGGFTLYSTAALRKVLPLRYAADGKVFSGWDWNLSRDLRRAGYRLLLHGGVRCDHRFTYRLT